MPIIYTSIGGAESVPSGSDAEVQFNDGGAWGGDSEFTWDKTNDVLNVGLASITASDGSALFMSGGVLIGSTAGSNLLNLLSDGSIYNGDNNWYISPAGEAKLSSIVDLTSLGINNGSSGIWLSQTDFRIEDYGNVAMQVTPGGSVYFQNDLVVISEGGGQGFVGTKYVSDPNTGLGILNTVDLQLMDASEVLAISFSAANRYLAAPITGDAVFSWGQTTLTVADDIDFVFGATNGTMFGTTAAQKIGFWSKTPIVQPTTAVAAATFAANSSGIANDTATFDSYTIGQVVKALRNVGILA